MRVTLSVTVLPNQELPGGEQAQIWVWARPLNADSASAAGVRRVPLSPEASCISFGESNPPRPIAEVGRGLKVIGRESSR